MLIFLKKYFRFYKNISGSILKRVLGKLHFLKDGPGTIDDNAFVLFNLYRFSIGFNWKAVHKNLNKF